MGMKKERRRSAVKTTTRERFNRVLFKTIVALAVTGIALVFTGCPMDDDDDGVSMSGRVNQLETDLNRNYNNVYLNWHPDTTTRQAAANPDTLETEFPSSESGSYEFTDVSTNSDTNSGTAVLNSQTKYNDRSVTFSFKKDGDDWMILSLSGTDTTLSAIE
jgi:hypothetical protein